jgi:hypothetical protein
MAILNKKYCDYVVFCPLEGKVYLERIPFNAKYWDELLFKLNDFIDNKLKPKLEELNKQPCKYFINH